MANPPIYYHPSNHSGFHLVM